MKTAVGGLMITITEDLTITATGIIPVLPCLVAALKIYTYYELVSGKTHQELCQAANLGKLPIDLL